MHGGLVALRLLARKYEFRDEEERAPLDGIIGTTFPLLLHIFRQLLAAPPSAQVGRLGSASVAGRYPHPTGFLRSVRVWW